MSTAPGTLRDFNVTAAARDAFRSASASAQKRERPPEALDLLVGLAAEQNPRFQMLLHAMGVEWRAIASETDRFFLDPPERESETITLSDALAQSVAESEEIRVGSSFVRVLEEARQFAERREDAVIDVEHLLFGLANATTTAARVLGALGISPDRVLEAIRGRLTSSGDTPGSPVESSSASPDARQSTPAAETAVGGRQPTDSKPGERAPVKARGDEPAGLEGDRLDFRKYVDAMSEMVRRTTPPLTIGILGTWGSGKSSMMQMIEDKLKQDQGEPTKKTEADAARNGQKLKRSKPQPKDGVRVVCVKFNAWQHTDATKVWSVLIRDVLRELETRAGLGARVQFMMKRGWASGYRTIRTRALPFAAMALAGVGIMALRAFFPSLLPQDGTATDVAIPGAISGTSAVLLGRELWKAATSPASQQVARFFTEMKIEQQPDYVSQIEEDIKMLSAAISAPPETQKGGQTNGRRWRFNRGEQSAFRVVIFIDDLDRCQPDQAVDVLEAVKLVLNRDLFVTFIGVDTRVLAKAVEKRYQGVLPDSLHPGGPGVEYLEKIIQLPFYINTGRVDLRRYIQNMVDPPQATADGERGSGAGSGTKRGAGPETDRDGADEQQGTVDDSTTGNQAESGPLPPPHPVTMTEGDTALLEKYIEYLSDNPRGVNRLANLYRFAKGLGRPDDLAEATLRWLILADRWPDFAAYAAGLLPRDDAEMRTREQWSAAVDRFVHMMLDPAMDQDDRARFERRKPVEIAALLNFLAEPPLLRPEDFAKVRQFIVNVSPARLMEMTLATQFTEGPAAVEQVVSNGASAGRVPTAT